LTTTAQRSIQRIHGRDYRVEVTQVTIERWRAHVINAHGGPTALMPFYATTADLAVTRLTDWLSLAHRQADKPAAVPASAAAGIAASPASATATGTGVP
jgi:hypothetical protein